MSPGVGLGMPLFLGPVAFLVGLLLVVVLILVIGRLVFSLAWRLIVIGAIVFGLLWLLGVIRSGPPIMG